MIRWLVVLFLALVVFNWLWPYMHKIGLGKLPGDFRFKVFGREWFIPLASSILLSLIAGLIGKFV